MEITSFDFSCHGMPMITHKPCGFIISLETLVSEKNICDTVEKTLVFNANVLAF